MKKIIVFVFCDYITFSVLSGVCRKLGTKWKHY